MRKIERLKVARSRWGKSSSYRLRYSRKTDQVRIGCHLFKAKEMRLMLEGNLNSTANPRYVARIETFGIETTYTFLPTRRGLQILNASNEQDYFLRWEHAKTLEKYLERKRFPWRFRKAAKRG